MVSIPIGITTTVAILLHEIPQEIGGFGILIHGGLSVKRALFFNLLTTLFSILGAVISLVIGQHIKGYTISLLPITAGGSRYIAGPDLLPELQQEIRVSTSTMAVYFHHTRSRNHGFARPPGIERVGGY